MISALTILLSCQLAGEALARAAHLPLPGPVVGLVLLLAILLARRRVPAELQATSRALLANLGFLFVPAGVGVITQLDALGRDWVPIVASLLVSTVAGLLATGWVAQALLRRR